MRFWDASALVPLVVAEPPRDGLVALLEADAAMLVWWGSPVECASAIARRERDGALAPDDATAAFADLTDLARRWHEILPTDSVRTMALRLLRVHPLRAADSLQLAAAIIAAEHEPGGLEFVCLDERLSQAAGREGFRLVAPPS